MVFPGPRVAPASLDFDPSGAPFSSRYGDVYASRDGAWGQARHVFLGGNGLPGRWAGRDQFVIVETGFGLGTNFLATWQAWRDDPQRPRRLHFVSVELHPLPAAELAAWAAPEVADLGRQLAAAWPLPLPGVHRMEFEGGRVVLTLGLGDAKRLVPQWALGADAFFLDGFAPARNPDLWGEALLKALARLARPGATLATYTAARSVQDGLTASGFEVGLVPGFGRKREMLVARFAPRWKLRRHEPPAAYGGERSAIVVGSGLAGASCAAALARRGWRVDVLERGERIASGASALPTGLLHPHPTADDSVAARLSRAGFLHARQVLGEFEPSSGGPDANPSARRLWQTCGVFRQAEDDAAEAAFRDLAESGEAPPEFLGFRDAATIAGDLGLAPRRGGLWFPSGAIVAAARWCDMLLRQPLIRVHPGFDVVRLDATAAGWRATSARGATLDGAIVVLANALDAPRLLDTGGAPLAGIGGRISLLQPGELSALRAGLAGDGYAVPAFAGAPAAIGATYETPLPGRDVAVGLDDDAAHEANRERLARMLARADLGRRAAVAGVFHAVRCVARDRLPLAGALLDVDATTAPEARARLRGAHPADLPRRAGAYALLALGSRGLALSSLAAEQVAAQVEGEPWPIERELAAALDPARFALQRLRAGRPVAGAVPSAWAAGPGQQDGQEDPQRSGGPG